MDTSDLLAFGLVAVVLAITPGPDTLLSLRYGLLSRRAGLAAATGTSIAIFGWAALAGTGVAAVLRASETAYEVLRFAGGAYLIYVGLRAIHHARRSLLVPAGAPSPPTPSESTGQASLAVSSVHALVRTRTPTWRSGLAAGVATCLTNPKTGLFFIALFPQFAPRNAHPLFVIVVLGGIVALAVYAYLVSIALLSNAASRWMARPKITAAIEATSGAILIVFGVLTLVPSVSAFIQSV